MPRPFLAPCALAAVILAAPSLPAQPAPLPLLNHYEFAQLFEPTHGRHHVTIIHPGSGVPVAVSFTLPCGLPQVRTYPRRIIFDYGISEVEIHFAMCGIVQVHYRTLGF